MKKEEIELWAGIWLALIMPISFTLIWGWKVGLGFLVISQFCLIILQLVASAK